MLRFWLSRETSIPIREQLSAQLLLGILSRKFAPGERLPSVRDLARRLGIHANTVSAVYQDLTVRGWVVNRRGSGVFVCADRIARPDGGIEDFARACLEDGQARGFTRKALLSAFAAIPENGAVRTFIVIDPDVEFARVVAAEVGDAVGRTVPFFAADEPPGQIEADTWVLVSSSHASRIAQSLNGVRIRTIELKSMQDVVAGHERPASPVLIGVVSRSDSILHWSSTLLSALGFPPETIVHRNPASPDWRDGLGACHVVATDVVSAADVFGNPRRAVFRIVSDPFLDDLCGLAGQERVTPA